MAEEEFVLASIGGGAVKIHRITLTDAPAAPASAATATTEEPTASGAAASKATLATNAVQAQVYPYESVKASALNPNGSLLCLCLPDCTQIIHLGARVADKIEFKVVACVFINDTDVALGSAAGLVVYDSHIRAEVGKQTHYKEPVSALAISPSGTFLASSVSAMHQIIKIMNAKAGMTVVTTIQTDPVPRLGGMLWLSDEILVSAAFEATIKVWNVTSKRLLQTLKQNKNDVIAIAASPDQTEFATISSNGHLITWDSASFKQKVNTKMPRNAHSVEYSSLGPYLFIGLYGTGVLEVHRETLAQRTLFDHKREVTAVRCSRVPLG
eukprot:m.269668 g.269668  ORF g.269668 m.269668 type:complete len:326 (+) comp54748_c0_seq1:54-1031(+)